jgi:hypothetical protein
LHPDGLKQEVLSLLQAPLNIWLEVESDISSPGGRHITYQQLWGGLHVFGGQVKVNLTLEGRVISLFDNLLQTPNTSAPDFAAVVPGGFPVVVWRNGEYGQCREAHQQDGIFWNGNSYERVRCYTLTECQQHEGAGFRVYLGLRSNPLRVEHLFEEYLPLHCFAQAETTATALVFNPDPLTTAGVTYGGSYVDANDATNASLDAQRQTVTLQGVDFTAGVYSLDGPHVRIEEITGVSSAPVTSTNGTFSYDRNQQGFEDVMCYYHIDTYQRYIQTLGFNNLYNSPLRVDAHGTSADNSSFLPNGTSSYIQLGEGGVDDAEDMDVILHEYGHALSYSGSPNTNTGTQRRGLDEGIGDYIASSRSRQLNPFNWNNVFSWDGHNTFWNGRSSTVGYNYTTMNANDIYNVGQLWATAMMEGWSQFGQEVSDRVFFQELYLNAPNITLQNAAQNVLDADSALYNGIHTVAYANIFCSRGLLPNATCTFYQNAAALPEAGPAAHVLVYPNPVWATQLHYQVEGLTTPGTTVTVTISNAQGQPVVQQLQAQPTGHLNVEGLPAGVYSLQIRTQSGQTVLARSFVRQ